MSVLWFGILTSISPCPLATNIPAISFIGRTRTVFISGLLCTFGRMIAYIALALILVNGLMAIEVLSNFLQKYMNKILGPALIFVGMVLLELINFIIASPTALFFVSLITLSIKYNSPLLMPASTASEPRCRSSPLH